MTYFSTQASGIPPVVIGSLTAAGTNLLGHTARSVGLAIAAIGRGRARRQTRKVLSQLDDRLLFDIGFSRFDVERLCAGGR